MGWQLVKTLEVDRLDDPSESCGLWTRGGLEGVEVHIDNLCISIPRGVLLELVADEYRSRMVAKYEDMSTDDAIAEIMGEHERREGE